MANFFKEFGGALIGAGAGLLGGGMNRKEARRARESQERQHAENMALQREMAAQSEATQREFAQHGIRWKVEDAKAAGLHPLFALGGSGALFSPSAVTVGGGGSGPDYSMGNALAQAGQDLGRAVTAQETAAQTNARLDLVANSTATKNLAEAELAAARANQIRTSPTAPFPDLGNASGWVGAGEGGGDGALVHQGRDPAMPADLQPFFDRRRVKPREIVSANMHDHSTTAGSSPHWDVYTLNKDGMQIQLPAGSSPSEAYESMAESKTLLGFVIARNVEIYGAKWMVQFLKSYGSLFNF